MNKTTLVIGKVLYALTFLLLVPGVLFFWAKYTEDIIRFPAIESIVIGWMLIVVGGLLMLLAMFSLKKYGRGLPMNAYPPSQFVTKGAYRIFHHPIYWGFGILILGYFVLSGSASGQWLVTPIAILGMIALVIGYEANDLIKRFPGKTLKTLLDLPEANLEVPNFKARFASLFWVISVLILSNLLVVKLAGNVPPLFGKPLVIHSGLESIYLSVFSLLFLIATAFLIKRNDNLKEWALSGIIASCISTFIALLYPVVGAQFLSFENSFNITIPVYLILISLRSFFKQSKRQGIIFTVVAIPIIIIQLALSRSAILHLITSILIFLLSSNYLRLWVYLKNSTEKIANSWKEWTFGKVRIINHGFYVGFGTFLGILLAGILVGDAYAWAILIFALIVIVFSALWAQVIEGSEKLKRPYGYYGALVGIIFASLIIWFIGFNVWVIIGVISVVMPWVQAIGRLRCLINGCCHGGKVKNPIIGIRYFHNRSRVCGISGLKGELLHPTPLYSIIWLFMIGFVLLSLWNHHFSSPFIFGLYLILTGIGRFVEEAYRGEVQTPILKGLRLYQWTAILSVIIGIIMTTINLNVVVPISDFGWQTILSALIGGLFTTFAMGVDFPYSNARFSRLV